MTTTASKTFLGTGWRFPPTFGINGVSVEMVSDEDDVRQSLLILISTTVEERIMHPIFGCNLQPYVFDPINQKLKARVKAVVTDAILRYETRIELNVVSVDQDEENLGLLHVGVDYTIRSTNSRQNLVFPFYIKEAD